MILQAEDDLYITMARVVHPVRAFSILTSGKPTRMIVRKCADAADAEQHRQYVHQVGRRRTPPVTDTVNEKARLPLASAVATRLTNQSSGLWLSRNCTNWTRYVRRNLIHALMENKNAKCFDLQFTLSVHGE